MYTCTTCSGHLWHNNESSTASPPTPPRPPSGFVCSKDFFLLHTQTDVPSQPVVLSRIILTVCHSSIHALADSQTIHALDYTPEGLYTHSHPVSTLVFPLLGCSSTARSSRGNRTCCFLYTAPCSRIISKEVTSTTGIYKIVSSDSVSNRHHWRCSQRLQSSKNDLY